MSHPNAIAAPSGDAPARPVLRVVSASAISDGEHLLRRAEALYRHDRDRAVDELRRMLAVDDGHAWRLLRAAKLLLSAGEADLGDAALRRAALCGRHQQRAFAADLSHARGLLAQLQRRDRDAERHLRSAHAADPSYAVFAASVMEFLTARRRHDEARAFADRAERRLTDRAYFDAVRRGLHL